MIQRKWWVLLSVGVGTFMSALDGSVINTILPVIRRVFDSDVATVEWVVTVYLLVVSGVLLSFGRLGDLYGHRRVYGSGFAIFGIASALCGVAPTEGWLIAFRGLQSVGAAMLFANGPALLTSHFPAAERGRALGLAASMTYLGLTAGPSLGGWLTATWSWRVVFYVNVPVAAAALFLTLRLIPRDHPRSSDQRFDVAGALTFFAGLVVLLLALNQGHAWGWTSGRVLALTAASAALLVAFVVIERRATEPMLDLALFRDRTFAASTASAVLNYVSIFATIFLLPFYLIQGRGFSVARAGLILTAQPLVMAVVAPLSGAVSDRVGVRAPATLGMVVLGTGLLTMSRLDETSSVMRIVESLLLTGLGTGLFSSPNNSALMGAAPRGAQGVAAGVLATARNVGMVLGIGISGAIFTTVLAHAAGAAPGAAVVAAVRLGFVTAAGCAFVGAFTSLIR